MYSLLHNWITICIALENDIEAADTASKANLEGFLKRMKNPEFWGKCVLYYSFLKDLASLCLQFQKDELLLCEIKPAVDRIIYNLSRMKNKSMGELADPLDFTFCFSKASDTNPVGEEAWRDDQHESLSQSVGGEPE